MNEQEYISQRLDEQLNWYDKKSQRAQKLFKWFRTTEILAAVSIPFIAGFSNEEFPLAIVVAILGALIVLIAAVISLNQFQENWIEYRTTCESLRQEKYLYLTHTQPYSEDSRFNLLVQRVEAIISKENSHWSQNTLENLEKSRVQVEKGE
ncbi:DUF4231 domain-containing protein [Paraglaciecola sp.]|uniref:DUF4231 domain-containing protein n=1 Tax=Paraglaciecola sp. TaxID=1920173 RepID=UPI003EF64954